MRLLLKKILWLTLPLMIISCGDSLDEESPQLNDKKVYHYKVTTNVVAANNKSQGETRSLEGEIKNLNSFFEKGTSMVIYNYTKEDILQKDNTYTSYNVLNADISEGHKTKYASFNGTYSSPNKVELTDDIVAFYPGFESNNDIYCSAKEEKTDGDETSFKVVHPTSRKVFLNFGEQKGTLEDLGKRFDVQITCAKPKTLDNSTTPKFSIHFPTMKRQIGIWGLTFTDENNMPFSHIDSVEIMNVTSIAKLDLKTGEYDTWFYNIGEEEIPANGRNYAGRGSITLHGKNNEGFNGTEMIYAALIPGTFSNIMFGVYANGKYYQRKYEGQKAYAKKNIAMSVKIDRCEEAKPIPFIKVAGVRWAPGNFVYCKYNKQEYWGIAPYQWWMSGLNMTPDFKRRTLSQFHPHYTQRYSAYGQQDFKRPINELDRDQEIDLFQWGVIKGCETYSNTGWNWPENTTYLNVGAAKLNNGTIQKSFYPKDLSLVKDTQINSPTEPLKVNGKEKYGDPVWYYTNVLDGNNGMGEYHKYHHYCMPSWEDIYALKTKAYNWPAYCYTTGGTDRFDNQLKPVRVYGWLFANPKEGEEDTGFSSKVGRQNWSMYIDATTLVKTGEYLFIPITGIRLKAGMVRYRDMRSFAAARMMSATAQAGHPNMIDVFMFGPTQYTNLSVYKHQSFAIRPIYDPSVKDEDVPIEANKIWEGFKTNPR